MKKTINLLIVNLLINYKIKPLHIMFAKTRAYVKSYDSQIKWMYFLVETTTYWNNIILFGLKLALILKRIRWQTYVQKSFFENQNKILRR